MTIEAMKDALITLVFARGSIEDWGGYASEYFQNKHDLKGDIIKVDKAITTLRQSIEQAEKQEPLEYWNAVEGWVKVDEVRQHFDSVGCGTIYKNAGEDRVPLYTAPRREWVGLTDGLKVILIKNAPNWTVIQLIEETEQLLKDQNS